MSFYSDWRKELNSYSCDDFIRRFLNSDSDSVSILRDGSESEIKEACEILSSININHFINVLLNMDDINMVSEDVPCFSNYYAGTTEIAKVLSKYDEGLGYDDLGYQLFPSASEGARRKYGGNHAVLAKYYDLTTITKMRNGNIVKGTNFASYVYSNEIDNLQDILNKLCLRNACIRSLIIKANCQKVRFEDFVSFAVHGSTIQRRRKNTKLLMELLLKNTNYYYLINNIDWSVTKTKTTKK
ncbi:MAG: hypothetical protein MJ057_01560 [Sphaerochaetaceae bacterium]|nr:hypothetical protein [Sphaerochaetaceae bacterium]